MTNKILIENVYAAHWIKVYYCALSLLKKGAIFAQAFGNNMSTIYARQEKK